MEAKTELPIARRLREPAFENRIHTVDLHNQAADIIEALAASLVELLEPLERAERELVALGKVVDENANAAFDRARAALSRAKED